MTDQNPIGVPQWSIDFWNEKRIKLDEIINEMKDCANDQYDDIRSLIVPFIEKLEKFKEEEL